MFVIFVYIVCIFNISWEHVNQFEINKMSKKITKTLIKHYNACF